MCRVLPWLQDPFIHTLATKHGSNVLFLYHALNRTTHVAYDGFIAYPEIHGDLTAFGKTLITRFRKDKESLVKALMKAVKA